MKKTTIITLAILLSFGLYSCSNDSDSPSQRGGLSNSEAFENSILFFESGCLNNDGYNKTLGKEGGIIAIDAFGAYHPDAFKEVNGNKVLGYGCSFKRFGSKLYVLANDIDLEQNSRMTILNAKTLEIEKVADFKFSEPWVTQPSSFFVTNNGDVYITFYRNVAKLDMNTGDLNLIPNFKDLRWDKSYVIGDWVYCINNYDKNLYLFDPITQNIDEASMSIPSGKLFLGKKGGYLLMQNLYEEEELVEYFLPEKKATGNSYKVESKMGVGAFYDEMSNILYYSGMSSTKHIIYKLDLTTNISERFYSIDLADKDYSLSGNVKLVVDPYTNKLYATFLDEMRIGKTLIFNLNAKENINEPIKTVIHNDVFSIVSSMFNQK